MMKYQRIVVLLSCITCTFQNDKCGNMRFTGESDTILLMTFCDKSSGGTSPGGLIGDESGMGYGGTVVSGPVNIGGNPRRIQLQDSDSVSITSAISQYFMNSFTVEFWARVESSTTGCLVRHDKFCLGRWSLDISGSDSVDAFWYNVKGNTQRIITGHEHKHNLELKDEDRLYAFAVSTDDNSFKLYIDGILHQDKFLNQSHIMANTTSNLILGSTFHGYIYSLKISSTDKYFNTSALNSTSTPETTTQDNTTTSTQNNTTTTTQDTTTTTRNTTRPCSHSQKNCISMTKKAGKRFIGTTLSTETVSSTVECAEICLGNIYCAGFTIFRLTTSLYCELVPYSSIWGGTFLDDHIADYFFLDVQC